MNILVIDGQGGKIGRLLVESIKKNYPEATITCVGTNSIATSSMIKGGCDNAATGENSVVVCSKTADIIVGPIGIIIADSLLGEITSKMANAVAISRAEKILLPLNRCKNKIVGVENLSVSELIEGAVKDLGKILDKK